jgi:membrane protein DedA with SNARE-associated domain
VLENAQAFLDWIAAHPGLALGLLFAASLLDALFIVGAFVPASIFLFGVGALVALGSLDLWHTTTIAVAGVLIGDGISFWLGRHYRERLFQLPLLQRHPQFVARGRAFFERHGGKGVWLARFLGPVRAVTPAMAGAAGMPVWQFFLIDVTAAYPWALIYILPGVLFGASMGLAAEVATRLAALLVLIFVLGGAIFWLLPMVMAAIQRAATRWLGPVLDWSRRHRHLGRFGAALADPQQPETPALAAVALMLVVFGGLWLFQLADAANHPYPPPIDAVIYQTLHDLQTPWGNLLAYAIAQLGSPWVYGPVAISVLGSLLARRKPHAAAHWIAALAFGGLISLGLHAVPIRAAPATYYHGVGAAALPRDLVMIIVIYGFIGVLLATQRPHRLRRRIYVSITVLITMILLSRLYLGIEWWSLTLFSLAVSLLWLGALGLGYRRHQPERLFARGFLLPVALVFVLAAGVRWSSDAPLPERPFAITREQAIEPAGWWTGGWQQLPLQRVDLRGQSGTPFNLQWAGDLSKIAAGLGKAGWQPLSRPSGGNLLRWLTATSSVDLLPLLPQVHAGRHPQLALRHAIDGEHQTVIRLWDSGWKLHGDAAPDQPIWVGVISTQTARTYYRLFRYPVTDSAPPIDFTAPPPYSQRQVQAATGSVWLIAENPSLYTAAYRDTGPVTPEPVAPTPPP